MEDLRKIPELKSFIQHGFIPISKPNGHVVGQCCFCGGGDKPSFYINLEKKAWDCKRCGKSGGFLSFLTKMTEHCQESLGENELRALSLHRGIAPNTLKKFGVGFNPITEKYIIPVRFPVVKKKEIPYQDVRIYDKKIMMSTSTCTVGLLNARKMKHCHGTVWLCEGEWDAMAMHELLVRMVNKQDVVLSTPGANTFKDEWIHLFKGKNVSIMYDNDKAGQLGAKKVYEQLSNTAKNLTFINWPDNTPDKYDIRDLYIKNKSKPNELFDSIIDMLEATPKGLDKKKVTKKKPRQGKMVFDGNGMPAEEVYAAYKGWLHLPDTSMIDVLFGTTISNRLDGDPLWLFLVAASGMTKSEFLQSKATAKETISTSSLTPQSLISGANFNGGDPSLIPKLHEKVLLIKDFTTILNMHQQARDEIFGIFRDAYDGTITKRFGNGVIRSYESKFSVIAGVTGAVDSFFENESALGERFLRFRIPPPKDLDSHLDYVTRAMNNTMKETNMRAELQHVGKTCLNYEFDSNVIIPKPLQMRIRFLGVWVAMMRGSVIRDRFSKAITQRPLIELGTRLAKQFTKMLISICMFRRKNLATAEEFELIKYVATSTAPAKLETIVKHLYLTDWDGCFTWEDLEKFTALPDVTCRMILEDLRALGVFKKEKINSTAYMFRFTKDILFLMDKGDIYRKTVDVKTTLKKKRRIIKPKKQG